MGRKYIQNPIIPITIAFVVGIFFGYRLGFTSDDLSALLLGLVLCLSLSVLCFFLKSLAFRNLWIFILSFLFFSILGGVRYALESPIEQTIDAEQTIGTLEIVQSLKPTKKYNKYLAVFSDKKTHSNEKVLLNVANENHLSYGVGDLLYGEVYSTPFFPKSSPFDFDYKAYMHNKHIYKQLFSFKKLSKIGEKKSFYHYIHRLRSKILEAFSNIHYSSESQQLIEALLFGKKENLSPSLLQSFQKNGTAHFLAVSGFHVLILFSILQFFLRRITQKQWLIFVCSLIFLVVFALLSDLTGSVVRASIMCLLYLGAKMLGRDAFSFGVLCTSVLLILWFSPNYLFDIGFQMSYLAVLSILIIFPTFRRLTQRIKNKKWRAILQFYALVFSIQLGVSVFTIYHFHQFPMYFLLSNTISYCIISITLPLLMIAPLLYYTIPWLGEQLAVVCDFLLQLLVKSSLLISNLQGATVSNIYIKDHTAIALILSIFLFALLLRKFQLAKVGLLVLIWIGWSVANSCELVLNEKKILVLYHQKEIEVLQIEGATISYFYKDKPQPKVLAYYGKQIKRQQNYGQTIFGVKSLFVIDSLGIVPKNQTFDIVVWNKNFSVYMPEMIKKLKPKTIIFTPTNNSKEVEEYQKFLEQQAIRTIDLKETGYTILE